MFSDLKFIIFWWLTILLVSLVFLPLNLSIFKKFWDKGYIFAKILSLILLTYSVFVLGVLRILPFTNLSIIFILLITLLTTVLVFSKRNRLKALFSTLRQHWKIFLFEEVLFVTILATWSYVRGFAPDIEGLEKFMDWGFINTMLRSSFMPPADMWYANEPINYYYFGHLIFALITKLSNINSAITYNLSIATVAALTFISSFSIVSNLAFNYFHKNISTKKLLIVGLLSSLLITFGGNLHAVYKIGKINIERNQGKLILTQSAISEAAKSYWYPDATRFIGFDPVTDDKTIHEFPIYSFVVSDLHGHMNGIPVVLFFLAFLFSISLSVKSFSSWKLIIPSAFLLSIAYMTNAWDIAIYGLFFGLFVFLNKLRHYNFTDSIAKTFFNGFLVIIFWYLFTLPFSLNFTPMMEGLRVADSRSPLYQLFILYGGFWLMTLPFLIVFIKNKFSLSKMKESDIFVFCLIFLATILIILPEIGYIKDIYIHEHRRANTMFKLVYQAFILYSLASGYILFRLKTVLGKIPFALYGLVFATVFVSHLIYPYFAIKSYYGSLDQYKGLWGLSFLEKSYPDNFAAIKWLQENVDGQPNIVEAAGDSYTTFNQVSTATGLPTIQGWLVHEWLWRGGFDGPGARADEVRTIYESSDPEKIKPLLMKYSIKYLFVGDKEFEKYPDINEKIYLDLGAKVVFESGKTKIYEF